MRKRPLIVVEWDDIAAHNSWIDEDASPDRTTPMRCVTVGWRLKSTKGYLVIASTRNEEGRCVDREAIPRGCIQSIRRLE